MTYEVYNRYTGEVEFEGDQQACEDFIGSYGGGWAALDIRLNQAA